MGRNWCCTPGDCRDLATTREKSSGCTRLQSRPSNRAPSLPHEPRLFIMKGIPMSRGVLTFGLVLIALAAIAPGQAQEIKLVEISVTNSTDQEIYVHIDNTG